MPITGFEEWQVGSTKINVGVTDDVSPRRVIMTDKGFTKGTTLEFTRPANTTAYAALDVLGVDLVVTGATNATPIVITCDLHSLADGDPITVSSVGGNTNANVDAFAKVTGYSTTTFAMYSDAALTTPIAGNSAYTSGGHVARLFKLPSTVGVNGGSGTIYKAQLFTDQKTCVAQVKVHIFTQPVTAILDNAPYLKLYANKDKRSGEILFPAMATEDSTNSTAASILADGNTALSNLPLDFKCNSADTAIYFMLETLTVFTPASGQKFYLKLLSEVY